VGVQDIPKKHPELPNVPLVGDYVKTDEARRLIKYGIQDRRSLPDLIFCRQVRRRIVSNYFARPLPVP
jgi:hypothetical protein